MSEHKDLSGRRFGRLVAVSQAEPKIDAHGRKRYMYLCQCDCGNMKVVRAENLSQGKTLSCGCLQVERASAAVSTHRDTDSRLYNVWSAIKRRCYNETVPEYRLYGGRGITMCDEWKNDYASFRDWAINNGYDYNAKRGECTIDRIDNNQGYYPENCRWVSQKRQMSNVSYNHRVSFYGKEYTIAELADLYDIPYSKLIQRIRRGWTAEDAVTKD